MSVPGIRRIAPRKDVPVEHVVGILCNDPYLPGRLYMGSDGGLVKEIEKAKKFSDANKNDGIEEIRALSPKVFSREVVEALMD